MCTGFIYRKEGVFIGMNFDKDGKDFKVASGHGRAFPVSVKANGVDFSSCGVNCNGVLANDLMVDSNGAGQYKRFRTGVAFRHTRTCWRDHYCSM